MNSLNEFLRWRELRDRGEPYSPGTDFDGWPVIASPLSRVGPPAREDLTQPSESWELPI